MKILILCNSGIEEFVAHECSLFFADSSVEILKGGVIVDAPSFEDVAGFCYQSQGASCVLALLGSFDCSTLSVENLTQGMSTVDCSDWLSPERSVAVRTNIDPTSSSRQHLEAELGAVVIKNTSCSVNLSSPDALVFVTALGSQIYAGVDLTGDLSKRDYRIFSCRETIKGPIAAALGWKAGVGPGQQVIDMFCRDGIIVIELICRLLGKSVHYYRKDKFLFCSMPHFSSVDFDEIFAKVDEHILTDAPAIVIALDEDFKHISSTKKNAKIAGVEKFLQFSRTEPDWIDTKFTKKSIQHIITYVPQFRKMIDSKKIEKKLRELFYQAGYVLADNGKVCCISKETDRVTTYAEQYQFKKVTEHAVMQGKENFFVVVYERA